MNTKQKMRKISGISLIVMALLLGFLSGCGKKGGQTTTSSTTSTVIVEQLTPLNETLLPLLDGFTSGPIAEGDPIVVRFKNPASLKMQYGENIPAKALVSSLR